MWSWVGGIMLQRRQSQYLQVRLYALQEMLHLIIMWRPWLFQNCNCKLLWDNKRKGKDKDNIGQKNVWQQFTRCEFSFCSFHLRKQFPEVLCAKWDKSVWMGHFGKMAACSATSSISCFFRGMSLQHQYGNNVLWCCGAGGRPLLFHEIKAY